LDIKLGVIQQPLNTRTFQAYTWLEEAMNEIRDFAEYIFVGNDEKLNNYKRDYWK